MPSRKRNRQNYFKGEVKENRKREFCRSVQGHKNKNCVKRFLTEKTKRQQKTKKKEIIKGRQGESNKKTPRHKKKQVDFGRTRGKRKRQRRNSKM